MTFTVELRKEADPIFEAIFNHPFVQGIAKGHLEKEQLIHYVKQDFEYLNAFMKVYGLAISRCDTRDDISLFNRQISFVLNSEIHPHHNFCQAAGVHYDDLQYEPLAPTANHYINHMLSAAATGSLGEIIAALLPCPWTYWEIGKKLIKEINPDQSHPFYDWITFYGRDIEGESLTEVLCERLDRWAADASEDEKQKAKSHFIKSCQLEYGFWDMAYKLEKWPVDLVTV
ncbi:thiaminase/transcriptional activator TenA [Scopulibacillus daqui]|uniref:Aminopyrimidine aminohydrolase n=1 Tax=Scopulibacillus daqui TaxID=1469162 RepID=A0ABS2PZV7_9BACL|nr:thiaminase II [Scopulibacillus daqui]MBM7645105.1 thiaminase/transcriptional activator TenA [Scopulibacillus daqui]